MIKVREFKAELWLPAPPEEVFPFFANAENLDVLTPPWLHFHIITKLPIEMKPGALIDYRLRIHGIPIRWCTRIVSWEPPHRFTDEQIRGPYKQWIHTHKFEAHKGGTLAHDHVLYATPLDFFVHRWFVQPDIKKIFKFREEALKKRFGNRKAQLAGEFGE